MKEAQIIGFNISEESLRNALITWHVSRTNDYVYDIIMNVRRMSFGNVRRELVDILKLDLPIRRFVPVFFVIEGGSRAWWDQFDRHKVGWDFWEQSMRIKDLTNDFDVYMPPSANTSEKTERFEKDAEILRQMYLYYKDELGWPQEEARWCVPVHIVTKGSAQANLSSVLNMVSTRSCFMAQGMFWRSIIKGLMEGLHKFLPELMAHDIVGLPCNKTSNCPYAKDGLDRIEDLANPICPKLIDSYVSPENQKQLTNAMKERYDDYYEICKSFAELNNVVLSEMFWNSLK